MQYQSKTTWIHYGGTYVPHSGTLTLLPPRILPEFWRTRRSFHNERSSHRRLQATQWLATYYYCTAKIPFFMQILRSVSKCSLRTTPYKLVWCGYKNSGTDILRCHQTSFFFMWCSPNVVSSDDDDDDNSLIFLYFGAQALQTLWWCKKDKAKLQLWKKYFPIRFAWRKASTKLQRWWLHQKSLNTLNNN